MNKQEIMDYVTETPHNVNKNILGQKLDEFQKNVSWNDLKDKPFYTGMGEVTILENQFFNIAESDSGMFFLRHNPCFAIGDHVTVIYNGEKFEFVAKADTLGDPSVANDKFELSVDGDGTLNIYLYESATLSLYVAGEVVYTIDPKYIKDMYYTEMGEEVILPETELTVDGGGIARYMGDSGYIENDFVEGEQFTVVYDGIAYDCVAYSMSGSNSDYVMVGNEFLYEGEGENNGMPFAIHRRWGTDEIYTSYRAATEGTHTYEIKKAVEVVHTIDPKYLPDGVGGSAGADMVVGIGEVSDPSPSGWGAPTPTLVAGNYNALMEKLNAGEMPNVVAVASYIYGGVEYKQVYKAVNVKNEGTILTIGFFFSNGATVETFSFAIKSSGILTSVYAKTL